MKVQLRLKHICLPNQNFIRQKQKCRVGASGFKKTTSELSAALKPKPVLNLMKIIALCLFVDISCCNFILFYRLASGLKPLKAFCMFLAVSEKPGYDFRDNDDVAFEAAGIYSSVSFGDVQKNDVTL